MNHRTSRKTIISVISLALLVGVILYALADRYLIEHIEITDASTYGETVAAQTQTAVSASATPSVANAVFSPAPAGSISADDWNYRSDSVSISIRQVVTGSGSNRVTYYVADVILGDAVQLRSAFAENSFGRNIIANTSEIAQQNGAVFAINGDYYGFRSDGIMIRNGVIYRDEPARTGLAFYLDGTMRIYDETQTSAQELLDAGVWNTLSFGPALVENSAVINNDSRISVDTNISNHSIQGNNPRTGVGMISASHFVFVVVDGRSKGYSRGVSLEQFAQIFQNLGCTDAYNLDGGGSSTMVFQGRVVNNPLGRNRERGTSDILFIGS
jgi:uncharacterized protein YigE (DUF2233 family)